MKSFEERNPLAIGALGVGSIAVAVITAFNYRNLPFIDRTNEYSAYFAEAGGLTDNSAVEVSGLRVGAVTSIDLDGA